MQKLFYHIAGEKWVLNEMFTERVDQANFSPRTQSNQQADQSDRHLREEIADHPAFISRGVIKCCGVIGWRDRRSYIAPPRSWSRAGGPRWSFRSTNRSARSICRMFRGDNCDGRLTAPVDHSAYRPFSTPLSLLSFSTNVTFMCLYLIVS